MLIIRTYSKDQNIVSIKWPLELCSHLLFTHGIFWEFKNASWSKRNDHKCTAFSIYLAYVITTKHWLTCWNSQSWKSVMLPVEEEGARLGGRAARVVLTLGETAQWIRTSGSRRTRTCHRRVTAWRWAQVRFRGCP